MKQCFQETPKEEKKAVLIHYDNGFLHWSRNTQRSSRAANDLETFFKGGILTEKGIKKCVWANNQFSLSSQSCCEAKRRGMPYTVHKLLGEMAGYE